jgi:adenine-specific DNA-methyltransferase
MPKPPTNPQSYKHKGAKRAHIPSREEAGTEKASPKVADGPKTTDYPKNPVVERGQDPELFWMNKYGPDDKDDRLRVDIRSLYRSEHIAPEKIIEGLYKVVESDNAQPNLFDIADLFGNNVAADELEKPLSYYKQADGWTNRIIQGDSLLVMASLAEREGLAGEVQTIYFDPPYGIKYNGNWQIRLNDPKLGSESSDQHLSGEPEQIKAFRDTWELGIHSYLSYIRDRLLLAKELLNPTGSVFVQISDENFHLVRSLLEEIFGADNYVVTLLVKKKGSQKSGSIAPVNDYVLWAAKDITKAKIRQLYEPRDLDAETLEEFKTVELPDGRIFPIKAIEHNGKKLDYRLSPKKLFEDFKGARLFRPWPITNGGERANQMDPVEWKMQKFDPPRGRCWSYRSKAKNGETKEQIPMNRLAAAERLYATGKSLDGKRYLDDFPFKTRSNWWDGLGGASNPIYIVQTNDTIVTRCLLMTSDPGDLVLDPTCGSGTTAFVAEQWGRRWITIDTSRIAVNVAKTRLLTKTFPHYKLADEEGESIRLGFQYKEVPHITLASIANDEPPDSTKLYDQPIPDNTRLRVAGPFTVETLQEYEPASPSAIASMDSGTNAEENQRLEERIFAHLQSAGIKTGDKRENAVFHHVENLEGGEALHATGFFKDEKGKDRKAYFHIGPKYGTVSRQAINAAVKECRDQGDADWLVILGFSFESTEVKTAITTSHGPFQVTRVRMADDLMQEGLIKKDKKAASFVTIGEPEIKLNKQGKTATVEIQGIDIYDPITDQVKSRDVADIAYWMLDPDYDGSNFFPRQIFFCGGDKDEYDDWKKGLSRLAADGTKKKVQRTLRIEIDDEAFDSLYGHESRPVEVKKGQKLAVRVISQFGEETTKVLTVP